MHGFRCESSDSELRTRKVLKNSDGTMKTVAEFSDRFDVLQMFLIVSVGEIDPSNVHACTDHVALNGRGTGGWTYRADDFCGDLGGHGALFSSDILASARCNADKPRGDPGRSSSATPVIGLKCSVGSATVHVSEGEHQD
jgi:hypothetical protein